jgi:hydrogenase large subunit
MVAGNRVADAVTMEWKLPKINNAIERVRARAYYHALSAAMAYKMIAIALDLLKKGDTKVWNEYKRPKNGIGVGMVEGMRGAVAHWVVMKNGKISRYQIITPTAWNVSPRDAEGRPGPYEASIIGSAVFVGFLGLLGAFTCFSATGSATSIGAVLAVGSFDSKTGAATF